MSALQCVQKARNNLATYLNNERTHIANRSVNDAGAISLLDRTYALIRVMQFVQVITEDEANELIDSGFMEFVQSGTEVKLPENPIQQIVDWDLATTPEKTIQLWWRARLNAHSAKLLAKYEKITDDTQKMEIINILFAESEAGGILGVSTRTERLRNDISLNKKLQELTGG